MSNIEVGTFPPPFGNYCVPPEPAAPLAIEPAENITVEMTNAPINMMINVSWPEYMQSAAKLSDLIKKNLIEEQKEQIDSILCIGRGGFTVGYHLSLELNKPLGVIMARSRGDGKEQEEIKIAKHVSFIGDSLGEKVLLVDDLVDTGATLPAIKKYIEENYPEVKKIWTAAIYEKTHTKYTPDFSAEKVDGRQWIVQPFERAVKNITPELAASAA